MLPNAPGPEPFPGHLLETNAASCTPCCALLSPGTAWTGERQGQVELLYWGWGE